ncbi:MAG: tol-pal system protein YbgF [Gammaproteobacteria bacterium]|nr:tol-pal system protein YbgF [Gammaproteobacteria bacterium]
MGYLHYVKAATLMAAVFSVSLVHADELEDRVLKLERMVNARNLSQIEMQQQIDALTNDVRSLRGALEESNYKLQQATERQKSLYQELDKLQQQPAQPQPAAATAPSPGAQPPADAAQQQPVEPAQQSTIPTQPTAAVPAGGSESKDYDAAVALVLKQKNYAQAIPAFDSFIANYPNSSLQPGAHYWLGQLLLNQGDREKAKTHFLTVAQKYKDSPKRPEAIYKLGVISKADGDTEKANKFFQLVIKQYPNTSAAQLAQKAIGG